LCLAFSSCNSSEDQLNRAKASLDDYRASPSVIRLKKYLSDHDKLDTSYRYLSWEYFGMAQKRYGMVINQSPNQLSEHARTILEEVLDAGPAVFEDESTRESMNRPSR